MGKKGVLNVSLQKNQLNTEDSNAENERQRKIQDNDKTV